MILITGTTGLVGSHLALQLLETEQIVNCIFKNSANIQKTKQVFDYYNKSFLFEKINWIEADILNIPSLEIAFQNITTVYHCAALISFDPKDEKQIRKTNIEGTANIVNFCLEKTVNRLCFISSIAALGNKLSHEKYISETTEWNNQNTHSDYAISKYGAEMEIFRGQNEGLSTIILNPGVILAPSFWKLGSSKIVLNIKKGLNFYTKGTTGFVSISDVTELAIKLTNSKIEAEKFIIVSENLSYKDLIYRISNQLNLTPPTIYASKTLTTIAYKLDWIASNIFGQNRKLSKQMAKSLHTKDFYDNSKIKAALDFEFESINSLIERYY